MGTKFKVGDRVKITDRGSRGLGKEGILKQVLHWALYPYTVWADGCLWTVLPDGIEHVEPGPAKFKIGDDVRVMRGYARGTVGTIKFLSETGATVEHYPSIGFVVSLDDLEHMDTRKASGFVPPPPPQAVPVASDYAGGPAPRAQACESCRFHPDRWPNTHPDRIFA